MTTSSTSPPSSADRSLTLGDTGVLAFFSGVRHGDQRPGGAPRPPAVPAQLHLRWLHQVHGATVVDAEDRSVAEPCDGDALVARDPGLCLSVRTADCAAIAMGSGEGVFAAVHAGWRGLVAGVVEQSAAAMRRRGATAVTAAVGPVVGPCCYEFSPGDLDTVRHRYGDEVVARTRQGAPALDLGAGVRRALVESDIDLVPTRFACTSCGEGWFSHRRDGAVQRQALFVWRQR